MVLFPLEVKLLTRSVVGSQAKFFPRLSRRDSLGSLDSLLDKSARHFDELLLVRRLVFAPFVKDLDRLVALFDHFWCRKNV